MVDLNITPLEIEVRTRHGDLVRADVYLPKGVSGPVPVLLGASPYKKALRHLPVHWVFPFIEYGGCCQTNANQSPLRNPS